MRVANRVLAATIGLALVAAAVVFSVEVFFAAFDRRPWAVPHDDWYDALRRSSWESAGTRWTLIFLVLLGVVLLWMQLAPRRPGFLILREHSGVGAVVVRRELERSLARAVESVDGVDKAKARLTGKTAMVRAETPRRQKGDLDEQVVAAARRHLERIPLESQPSIRVRLKRRGEE